MKKFALLAITMLMATSSQAVSFKWASNGKVTFGGTEVASLTPNTYTALLVNLGAGSWGTTTISESGLTLAQTTKTTADSQTSIQGKTGTLGSKSNSTFSGTFNHAIGSTTGDYTVAAGDVFGVMLTYTDSANKTWYSLSTNTYTLDPAATDISTLSAASFTFTDSKNEVDSGSSVSAGGWYTAKPVPEPSTAALALAGLALLLKRRRA